MDVNNLTLKRGGIRIGYIDALKGFAILCVVLGHIADGYLDGNTYPEANQALFCIYNIIFAFHMPLFMMISGYVYAVAYFDAEGRPDRRKLYRQVGNNVIVYALFSVLFGLSKVLLSRYTNKPVALTDILLIWGKPIDLYWYLYSLVLLYLLFTAPMFRKAEKRIVACVLLLASILSSYISVGWFQISRVLYYALFFYLGASDRRYSGWLIGKKMIAISAFAVSIILCAVFWNRGPYTAREAAVFLNSIPVANVVIAIGISLMLWYLFGNVKWLAENRFLMMLGRYSLEIYVTHCFFTAGFRAVLPRTGVSNAYISVALNFIFSTSIPLVGALICKRLGIHDLIFRPMNYISRLKDGQS